ncbi:hypothetical protein [Acidaminococcus massiliensis]|uniref:hypothetical protein n=1 Tax=Acidaminococcus massiliensis TaxID=1852375 RepID=UPI002046EA69|nr:hypothetical protein [Acidaminococcus massiliensis]DAR24923.1 MAG TPA: hypothetical protein [Caudoviricetes sp.]
MKNLTLELALCNHNYYDCNTIADAKRIVTLSRKINRIDTKVLNDYMTEEQKEKLEVQRKKAFREAAMICGLYHAFAIYNPDPRGASLWVRWENHFPEGMTDPREKMAWLDNTETRGIPAV